MSSNGNGGRDDEIDDLIREMRNTNRNLENVSSQLEALVNSIVQGAREEEEEELGPEIDMWNRGRISAGTAHSPDEYVRLRRQAAVNEEVSVPMISADDNVDFMFEVFIRWGEHLQRVYYALGNKEWKRFIQRLAVENGVTGELVEILNPGTMIFGINVVDDEVTVFETSTHMNFMRVFGNIWFAQGFYLESPSSGTGPWDSLQVLEPTQDSIDQIQGQQTPEDIDRDLAKAIDDRPDLSLPDDYLYLL